MAKQTGIFKVKGTLDETTFYRTKDGDIVKRKGGVSGSRIKTDPAFARTRENGAEFSIAAKAGKLLRHTFSSFVSRSADGRVTSRLTQRMTKIKNLDATSIRGERNVATGIATSAGKELLKGFNFNGNVVLDSILTVPYTVDLVNGKVLINGFVPGNNLSAPPAATHYNMQAACAVIDFASGVSSVEVSNEENGELDFNSVNVALGFTPPTGTGIKVVMLHIEFLQEVNGLQYELKNGAFNALAVVEVA